MESAQMAVLIFCPARNKSARIMDVFRAFLTRPDGKSAGQMLARKFIRVYFRALYTQNRTGAVCAKPRKIKNRRKTANVVLRRLAYSACGPKLCRFETI
jgi:hypothetical protein